MQLSMQWNDGWIWEPTTRAQTHGCGLRLTPLAVTSQELNLSKSLTSDHQALPGQLRLKEPTDIPAIAFPKVEKNLKALANKPKVS